MQKPKMVLPTLKNQVLLWPHSKLKRVSAEVTEFDANLRQLVLNLHDSMAAYNKRHDLPDAAGLSAPQIGVMKRVFVYKLDGEPSCMVNPVILESNGEQKEPEGCLSFPGVFVKVPRASEVLVEFQDVDGNKNRLKTDGFLASVIQHEIDHLDGQTFLKALSKLNRDKVTAKMIKHERNFKRKKQQIESHLQRTLRSR